MLNCGSVPLAVSKEEVTVGELIEAVYQRFDDATLSYGHGK